jgi:hypothetical protein
LRIDTRAGSWILISGQIGVPLPPDKGSVTAYRAGFRVGFAFLPAE